MRGLLSNTAARSLWALVTAVGVLVIALVLVLQLIPRLDAGQRVLNDARPAFTGERVAGDRAGITIVSQIVDLADPIVTPRGGAAAEVPKLVGLVSAKTGLSQADVLAALQQEAPRTTQLLQAIPLTAVTDELPGLVTFLATTLRLSEPQVGELLKSRFPRLAQSITALPVVTKGWDAVPGTEGVTRFDGSPLRTVRDVRDSFSKDVIPVLERQRGHFAELDGRGGVSYIPWLLLTLGGLVTFFGGLMLFSTRSGPMSRGEGMAMWGVVTGGGLVVIVLVLGLSLFPRLNGGQDLLSDAKPAFTDERVAGHRAGIDIVSSIVDLADPIATDRGGGAAEVPELVAFVARKTGLSQGDVLAALQDTAPHTTALLQAIPLSAVYSEIPHLAAFLSETLGVTGDVLIETLRKQTPAIAQVIANVGPVTASWNSVRGISPLRRFDGRPVQSVPEVRDYFSQDVVPLLERRHDDFQRLESTAPGVDFFPPLLLIIGIVVTLLGGTMVLASRQGFTAGWTEDAGTAPAGPVPAPR